MDILYFCILLFLSSWSGIILSENFIESFLYLEILYLSLIFLSSLLSILTNFFLFDLLIVFILFFSICDSILGLILTLVTFNTNKNLKFNYYSHLDG